MKSPSRKPRSSLIPVFLVLLLLAATALWFLFMRSGPEAPSQPPTSSERFPITSANDAEVQEPPSSAPLPGIQEEQPPAPSLLLPHKDNIPLAVETIKNFYHHLDQQPYIQARKLDTASETHFTGLIQKSLDSPPVVIRETDDLYTILKNNTHFFRILGKNNILLIKEILSREPEKIEDVLAAYYLLTAPPLSAGRGLSLNVPDQAMIQYATFFLDTMGGRLYLSRRDSRLRMLITYYAIRTIHRANGDGKNLAGLQLQPAIDLLITDMETGGGPLRHKETYLDTLYDLKEKYQ